MKGRWKARVYWPLLYLCIKAGLLGPFHRSPPRLSLFEQRMQPSAAFTFRLFAMRLLFGATGVVGAWTSRKALEHGHDVTFHIRDKTRLPEDILNSGKVKVLIRPRQLQVTRLGELHRKRLTTNMRS